jgi:hypothetical protein
VRAARGGGLAAALATTLLTAAPAQSQSPGVPARAPGVIRALEQALETRGADVALPAGGVGTVTVTPCTTCRPVTMLAGSTSAWMLGDRAVAFDEMRRALQSNPRTPVLVFYRGPGAELTRLVVRAARVPSP